MDVYAPDSPITVGVGVNHYSGAVGKTLDVSLPVLGRISEDQSLGLRRRRD